MIGALARSRLRLARRSMSLRPRTGGWARHPLAALVVAAGMAGFVWSGTRMVFAMLAAAGSSPRDLAGALALMLSAAVLTLLVFDVDDVVRTLVSDDDLVLLRRAPVPPLALLALKVADALPRTALPVAVLALPAVMAHGAEVHAGPAYVALAALVLLALWLAPLAAGAALGLLVLRVAPAHRARETLALLSTVVLTVVWIAGAIVVPRALESEPAALAGVTATLGRGLDGPGPAPAAARALAAAATGSARAAAGDMAALAAMLALAVVAALVTGQRVLPAVLERVASGSAPSARARRSRHGAAARPWRTTNLVAAIVRRDGLLLRRSWPLLGDLAVASALWTLLPLAGTMRWQLPPATLAQMMLLAVAVGLGYEIAARSIPFERHGAYWARLAPVDSRRWLGAKLAGSALLALPVLAAVTVAVALAGGVGAGALARSACLAVGALALSSASGAWAGVVFGDPEWINPRAMLKLNGRLLTSVLLLVEIAFWLGVGTWLDLAGSRLPVAIWGLLPGVGLVLAWAPFEAARRRLTP